MRKAQMVVFIVTLCGLVFALTSDVFSESLVLEGKARREKLLAENLAARLEGLTKIATKKDFDELKLTGLLVPVPLSVKINSKLGEEYRWVRPEAADFLDREGVRFIDRFGRRIQLNSASRTVPYQIDLAIKQKNLNAAPALGETASTHLTGASIDITKYGMNDEELKWIRERLLELQTKGLILATEEINQSCFHVMVLMSYTIH